MTIDIQKAKDWADLLLKVVSIVAIIAGGWWAYYQFWVTDTTASNIQLALSTEVVKYSGDYRLLLIHAKPRNIGKVLVTPGKDGFLISVRKLPDELKPGVVDLKSLPEIYRVNLLKRFPDGYEMEPGVEYDEVETLIVQKGGLYSVKAVMDLGDNTEVDQTTIVRAE